MGVMHPVCNITPDSDGIQPDIKGKGSLPMTFVLSKLAAFGNAIVNATSCPQVFLVMSAQSEGEIFRKIAFYYFQRSECLADTYNYFFTDLFLTDGLKCSCTCFLITYQKQNNQKND
ncbi:hypothetical protein ACO0LM_26185 [Undibacterium sp. Di26W]|uniref:hypothetical protein n=1 Tax=Undibacterium sp. Di26W TaxID=3413035 RepID=UPI003BF22BE7